MSRRIVPDGTGAQHLSLGPYTRFVEARLEEMAKRSVPRRIRERDPSVWSDESASEVTDRLGWLDLPEAMETELDAIEDFVQEALKDEIRQVVLLGMGGSSLAPEVFHRILGAGTGHPRLVVVDTIHPDAVTSVTDDIDPEATLFLVSSKSGATIESLSLYRHFRNLASAQTRFVAITDPGTPLTALAREEGFDRVFAPPPDVGGRFSALTHFGLVPAALVGVDIRDLLARAVTMAETTRACVPGDENPALVLGATLGTLAVQGRDKATVVVSRSLKGFPDWVEQLLAASTGKSGKGILPVVGEPLGDPSVYGDDRVFIHWRLLGDDDDLNTMRLEVLERAGHPVVRIRLDDLEDIAREMYRAEYAVAVAGAVLGIHPFNQPDVQVAKDLARQAMQGELSEALVPEVSAFDSQKLPEAVSAWVHGVRPGDYAAIQVFLEPTAATTAALREIRRVIRDRFIVATTFGYGPRFLHSTGQFHKGGTNTGMFLQLVDEPADDIAVPRSDYTFGRLISAQSIGDYQALAHRGRPLLRLNLRRDISGGLTALRKALGG